MQKILAAVLLLGLSGCTAVDVMPVDSSIKLNHVCIEHNTRVQVGNFVSVLQNGFDRHGITTEVVPGDAARRCEFVLYYTALRSWDISPYLSHAELRLRRNRHLIASADYHLRGKGGFSLTKWSGTESKIGPVVDELLSGYQSGKAVDTADDGMISNDVFDQIVALEERRKSGELSDEEFETLKQAILEKM